jgi:hypothetical protein
MLPSAGLPCLAKRFICRDLAILLFVAKAQYRESLGTGPTLTSDRLKVSGLLRLVMLRRAQNVAAAIASAVIESALGLFVRGGFSKGFYPADGEVEAEGYMLSLYCQCQERAKRYQGRK